MRQVVSMTSIVSQTTMVTLTALATSTPTSTVTVTQSAVCSLPLSLPPLSSSKPASSSSKPASSSAPASVTKPNWPNWPPHETKPCTTFKYTPKPPPKPTPTKGELASYTFSSFHAELCIRLRQGQAKAWRRQPLGQQWPRPRRWSFRLACARSLVALLTRSDLFGQASKATGT